MKKLKYVVISESDEETEDAEHIQGMVPDKEDDLVDEEKEPFDDMGGGGKRLTNKRGFPNKLLFLNHMLILFPLLSFLNQNPHRLSRNLKLHPLFRNRNPHL